MGALQEGGSSSIEMEDEVIEHVLAPVYAALKFSPFKNFQLWKLICYYFPIAMGGNTDLIGQVTVIHQVRISLCEIFTAWESCNPMVRCNFKWFMK
jgi:hypothetical protein